MNSKKLVLLAAAVAFVAALFMPMFVSTTSAHEAAAPQQESASYRPASYIDWNCVEYDLNVVYSNFPWWWKRAVKTAIGIAARTGNPFAAAAAVGLAAPVVVAIYNDCKR